MIFLARTTREGANAVPRSSVLEALITILETASQPSPQPKGGEAVKDGSDDDDAISSMKKGIVKWTIEAIKIGLPVLLPENHPQKVSAGWVSQRSFG